MTGAGMPAPALVDMPRKRIDPRVEEIRAGIVPRHVAIIMDGNGRWAGRRFLPRIEGHRAGAKSVRRALETSIALGVRCLTLYTFSLENWERPRQEISDLMKMLKTYLLREKSLMLREGVRLRAVGQRELLPPDVRETLARLEEATGAGRRLDLVLALSYGSRQEIAGAALDLAAAIREGRMKPGELDTENFADRLYTAGLPPVELLIRTSGEHRLSNFLLWQAVGAHLHFTPTLWPDFREDSYYEAVRDFQAARGPRASSERSA